MTYLHFFRFSIYFHSCVFDIVLLKGVSLILINLFVYLDGPRYSFPSQYPPFYTNMLPNYYIQQGQYNSHHFQQQLANNYPVPVHNKCSNNSTEIPNPAAYDQSLALDYSSQFSSKSATNQSSTKYDKIFSQNEQQKSSRNIEQIGCDKERNRNDPNKNSTNNVAKRCLPFDLTGHESAIEKVSLFII